MPCAQAAGSSSRAAVRARTPSVSRSLDVCCQAAHPVGQRGAVAGREHQSGAVVRHQACGCGADGVAGYDGGLLEHGFVHNQPPRFLESCGSHGGQDKGIGGGVQGGKLSGRQRTPGTGRRPRDLRPCRPAGPCRPAPAARAARPAPRQASSRVSMPFSGSSRPTNRNRASAGAAPARSRAAARSAGATAAREVVHVHGLRGHEHVAAPAPVALDVAGSRGRRRWPRRRRGGRGAGSAARTAGGRACAGAPRSWPTARTGSGACARPAYAPGRATRPPRPQTTAR